MGDVGAVINRTTRHSIEDHGCGNSIVTSEHAGAFATGGNQNVNRRSSVGLVVLGKHGGAGTWVLVAKFFNLTKQDFLEFE